MVVEHRVELRNMVVDLGVELRNMVVDQREELRNMVARVTASDSQVDKLKGEVERLKREYAGEVAVLNYCVKVFYFSHLVHISVGI